jgi:glucan 1,3-beta-glucosidase
MAGGGTTAQSIGSITVLDSNIINTQVGIVTAHTLTSQPSTGGIIILENVSIKNVGVTIQGPSGAVLQGGSITITAWGEGHRYTPSGPVNFEGGIPAFSRPPSLTVNGNYYTRSKPQY